MRLPTLIVAGAQKSGTTSLHTALDQHPAIHMSTPKELHFFDRDYDRGLPWYSAQFHPGPEHQHWGESTPYYMYSDVARDRMVRDLPDTRFLVVLREPVSRAYSHYWFAREKGKERLLTFEEAIRREPDRLARSRRAKPQAHSYLDRGRYIDQLEPLADALGRERLHVMLMEDLIDSPGSTMRAAFEFLDVDPSPNQDLEVPVTNTFGSEMARVGNVVEKRKLAVGLPTGKYPEIRAETKEELRAQFRDVNDRLAQWLGRDLSHWN